MKIDTKCVHAGGYPDAQTRGINTPIFTSSAYGYLDTDTRLYQRYFNTPNQEAVVKKICELEGAEDGIVFSSGMAAISTVLLSLLKNGDHAVVQDEIYGGSHAFVEEHLGKLGISFTLTGREVQEIEKATKANTKLIYIESPTNPLLNVVDIHRVAGIGKQRGILTVIDNTFATPINQNPFLLGIDVVLHSGTKYLGGHSDLYCGVAVARKDIAAIIRKTASHQKVSGDVRKRLGISDNLLRLSVGIENVSDLIDDIRQALEG
ncbi:MAG: PLP-dependent transferase [Nitrospirae bacterium]|nr:PLP-dependent transferase [Nitrospirota bacterium]